MTPPPSDQSTSKAAILPLTSLVWLALLYTWLVGHLPSGEILTQLHLSGFFNIFSNTSLCLFKQLTHLPCVFCGMTRSFILIGQGKPLESISYHWLGIPVYFLACFFAVVGLCFPDWTARTLRIVTQKLPVALTFTLLAICWLWKIGHHPRFW